MTLEEMAMLHLHNDLGLNDPRSYTKASGGDVQAVNRITRTPITFTQNLPDKDDPNAVGAYSNWFSKGPIRINPTMAAKEGDIPETIRHEAIHAALDKVPGYESITGKGPLFSAGHPSQFMGGAPERELPAYLASYPVSQIRGISNDQRQQYLGGIIQQLQKSNPSVAMMIQRIMAQR